MTIRINLIRNQSLFLINANVVDSQHCQQFRQLIEASGNIYLDARNNQFELLNEVFGTNIKAVFNQDAYNQLVSLTKQKDELESDFDNDIKHDEEESDNG